jgi:hypothetical protein
LRRILKWSAGIAFVIVTALGSVLYVFYEKTRGELEVAKQNVTTWEAAANLATQVETEANAKVASLANLDATVKFFADATQTGPRRAAAVDLIRRYIMPDSLVSSIDISNGRNVTIVASVADSDDYGRLLLNLRAGTTGTLPAPPLPYVWKTLPMASGVPGYPLPAPAATGTTGSAGGAAATANTEPTAKIFPLNISIAGELTDDLAFTSPLAPGETEAAAAGQPGAPPR